MNLNELITMLIYNRSHSLDKFHSLLRKSAALQFCFGVEMKNECSFLPHFMT